MPKKFIFILGLLLIIFCMTLLIYDKSLEITLLHQTVADDSEAIPNEVPIGGTIDLLGDTVTIVSVARTADKEIVITFDWTNRREQTTNWVSSINENLRQDNRLLAFVAPTDEQFKKLIENAATGETVYGIKRGFTINNSYSLLQLEIENHILDITIPKEGN